MDALWPELAPEAAGANLRKALFHARGALNRAAPGGGDAIAFDADVIALKSSQLLVDVEQFRSALTSARRSGDIDAYQQATDTYRGDLLPDDRYDEWTEPTRAALHAEYLAALKELAAALEARGALPDAIDAVRRLVAAESTDEEGHATLMRLYMLAGRRTDAVQQYEHLRRILDEELGTEPDPATQRLYEEIRAHQETAPELSAELWERVGDLRIVSGDHAGAAKAYELALGVSANGAAGRIERKCAEAWLMQHRPDMALSHLESAEKLTDDPAERGRLLRAQANYGWETGDIESAQRYADLASEAARTAGTADDVAAAEESRAIVAHFKGQWREGLASELDRLAVDASNATQLGRVFDIHHCIGQYHLYGDGLSDSVEDYARRLLDRALDAGAVRAQAFAWCLLGESLLLQARWDESDSCLERSCALHASFGSRSGALPWQRRAEVAVCRGQFADVEAHLREASAIATVSPMALHMWGRIYATHAFSALQQHDVESAVRAVHDAAAAAARYGDCPSCSALLNPLAAEGFAAKTDSATAATYAHAAKQVASMFASAAWRAMADAAQGSADLARGDVIAAQSSFEAAAEGFSRAGQPYWAQRSAGLAGLVAA